MFIGKNVVHFPTMKVHGHTTITGAMKNAFGGLITKKRHHCHKKIHEVLVDLLAIQKEIHPCIFAVMDGTVAGDGAGPRTMIPRVKNYILASGDQVAIDQELAEARNQNFTADRQSVALGHHRRRVFEQEGDDGNIDATTGAVPGGGINGSSTLWAKESSFRHGRLCCARWMRPLLHSRS